MKKKYGIVPPKNGTTDFFYLYDLDAGAMGLKRAADGAEFTIQFDKEIFPCAWLFASYGGFLDHYTAVLEPCTTMPISVNDARTGGICSSLEPGAAMATSITITITPGTENV